ncbi:MAG: SHOCT domain-containing protein [Gammaproteobacteria bacterium]|jgi:putative membrane protein
MYGNYGWHGYGMGYGMGGFGWVFMVLVWVLLIVGIAAVVRWVFFPPAAQTQSQVRPEKSALDIVEERYARGEIDREEFEEKRRALGGKQ